MRERLTFGTIGVVTAVAGVLHFAGAGAVRPSSSRACALGGLAWAIGSGTEVVGGYYGPAVTGVLQTTLGNLPELFVVLFALSAGEVVVAQFSIIGSLFANALLVLGLVIVAGSRRRRSGDAVRREAAERHGHAAADGGVHHRPARPVQPGRRPGLPPCARDLDHRRRLPARRLRRVALVVPAHPRLEGRRRRPRRRPSAGVRDRHPRVAGAGAAFVSDWFVAALDPAVRELGISKTFTGLVIVAIAGNAVENVVGITLARKGRSELAVSLVKNSVAQIAVFLFPLLVLLSLFFDPSLTFVVDPIWIGALTISALAVWQITGDGEAALFEGLALVSLYAILATVAWYE